MSREKSVGQVHHKASWRNAPSGRCPRRLRAAALAAASAGVCAAAAISPAWGAAAAAAGDERVLHKEITIKAPAASVWRAWTDSAEMARFFSPDSKIELKIGGAYELYMGMAEPDESGRRGSEGCKVLSFIPGDMLAFEWSFPPAVPTLRHSFAMTQVVLRFKALDAKKTQVLFDQLGWKTGDDWDAGYAYFDRAWDKVLGRLKEHLESGSPRKPSVLGPPMQTWQDGTVKVSAVRGVHQRQDFEIELPAPVQRVWDLLTTREGLKRLGGPEPMVELRPGGPWAFWPGSPNRVLAFVPGQMLSTRGGAPPQFPTVQRDGTWGAFYFEPAGKGATKLTLTVVGWRPGEKEWDDAYEYFLKNNPIFLRRVLEACRDETAPIGAEGADTAPGASAAGNILRHSAIIDAPVEAVWAAMTTKEGMESWMVAHAEIDLRVGGKMRTHYSPDGVIGDENTIENIILSYEPQRMLSIKVGKPPAKFPFKAAVEHMWSVVHFEPVGKDRTRFTVCGMGYGDDEESLKLRAFFDKGNDWTVKQLQRKFAAEKPGAPGESTRPDPADSAAAAADESGS